jgi:hypothetical protein
MCRVSTQIAGKPASASALKSHCDSGLAAIAGIQANVRFGSKADLAALKCHFRFSPVVSTGRRNTLS